MEQRVDGQDRKLLSQLITNIETLDLSLKVRLQSHAEREDERKIDEVKTSNQDNLNYFSSQGEGRLTQESIRVIEHLRASNDECLKVRTPLNNYVESSLIVGNAQNGQARDILDLLEKIKSESREFRGVFFSTQKKEVTKEEKKVDPSGGAERQQNKLEGKRMFSLLQGYRVVQLLGKGLHGLVFKMVNIEGSMKAVKLCSKKQEQPFVNEVSILSRLRDNDMGGSVGISTIIETNEYYGFIIDAGVGTLQDFRKFLHKTMKSLTQDELIAVLAVLLDGIKNFQRGFVCHRDIKPHNIILHPNGLKPELIDYSLAVCYQEPISELVGTMGYIHPMLLREGQVSTGLELMRADHFSLGVTLLTLVNPTFEPDQAHLEDQIEIELDKLQTRGESFSLIYRMLRALLCSTSFEECIRESRIPYMIWMASKAGLLIGDLIDDLKRMTNSMKALAETPIMVNSYGSVLKNYEEDFVSYLAETNNHKRTVQKEKILMDTVKKEQEKIRNIVDLSLDLIKENFPTVYEVWKTQGAGLLFHKVIPAQIERDSKAGLVSMADSMQKTRSFEIGKLKATLFMDHCVHQAIDAGDSIVELGEQFLGEFLNFMPNFYLQKDAPLLLADGYELLMSLMMLNKIFLTLEEAIPPKSKLANFVDEAKMLDRRKEELFKMFATGQVREFVEILLSCKIFQVMFGLTFMSPREDSHTRDSQELIMDKIRFMSDFTKSFKLLIPKKSYSSNINMIKALRKALGDKIFIQANTNHILSIINGILRNFKGVRTDLPQSLKIISSRFFWFYSTGCGYEVTLEQQGSLQLKSWLLSSVDVNFEMVKDNEFVETVKYLSAYQNLKDFSFEFVNCRNGIEPAATLTRFPLTSLKLSFTQSTDLSDERIGVLSDVILHLKSLEELVIATENGSLTGEGIKNLQKALVELKRLRSIRLKFQRCSNITDKQLINLAAVIASLPVVSGVELVAISCARITFRGVENVHKVFKNRVPRIDTYVACRPL